MTNEEAINFLKNGSLSDSEVEAERFNEAYNMAIKALETVSCIKEKCAYCPHCENCDVDDETLEIKALEQQPCEDVISRDCDKCAYYDNGANDEDEACDGCFADEYEHPNFKPKAQHYEDCISRQAVDELSKELVHTTRDKADFLCNFWEGLQKLPPVTPKSKSEYEHDHEVVKAYNDGQAYILDKIRAEIEQGYCKVENDYDKGRNMGLHIAMQIIDKYRGGE